MRKTIAGKPIKKRKPVRVRCPECNAETDLHGERGEAFSEHCGSCLDKGHRDFVLRMADRGIFPYGKAYAEKLKGRG
jgi:hypothetical protein